MSISITFPENYQEFISPVDIKDGKSYLDVDTNQIFIGNKVSPYVAFSLCGTSIIQEDDTAYRLKEIDLDVVVKYR